MGIYEWWYLRATQRREAVLSAKTEQPAKDWTEEELEEKLMEHGSAVGVAYLKVKKILRGLK